jgi:DNA-3-methyladenine glycosylase
MSESRAELPDLSTALTAAHQLLGWRLAQVTSEGMTSGIIVETEAYTMEDAASHAYGGERPRNSSMFRPAGTIYIYFTYGMHYCLNIVTGTEGHGQGVLLRALEPVDGIDIMKRRRGMDDQHNLTNGPAKLVQAMGISKSANGTRIQEGPITLLPGIVPERVVQAPRIGISKAVDLPWRFYIADNPYVSRK